jgi:hypothetical protein
MARSVRFQSSSARAQWRIDGQACAIGSGALPAPRSTMPHQLRTGLRHDLPELRREFGVVLQEQEVGRDLLRQERMYVART